jgi:hypothetical protein
MTIFDMAKTKEKCPDDFVYPILNHANGRLKCFAKKKATELLNTNKCTWRNYFALNQN